MQYLLEEFSQHWTGQKLFEIVANLEGETYREIATRKTFRFELGAKSYFAKIHYGVGWQEIVKNLIQFKIPVLSAQNEWDALNKLAALGIDTLSPVGFGHYGINPATIKSFIITRELKNTESLEDYCSKWKPEFRQKFALIKKVSKITRLLHDSGVNHQDLYICHFLMDLDTCNDEEPLLYLIDLHRAQIRARLPLRWRVKDIGAIFFSCFDIEINRNDIYRFMKSYTGKKLKETLKEDVKFWHSVLARAKRLYLKNHSTLPEWISTLRI